MRILILAYGVREGHSGFKHRVLQMASELKAQSHSVTLLWYFSIKSLFRKHDLHSYPFEVITVPTLPYFLHPAITPLARLFCTAFMRLFLRFRKFDAIQAEVPWCTAMVGRTRAKLVSDFHGAGVPERILNGDAPWKVRLQEQYERIAIERSDAIITVSNRLRAHVCRAAGRRRPPEVVVAPCGVDTDAFARNAGGREEVRAEFGMGGRIVLCYLGGLQVWQAIDETLEMAARLRRMDNRIQLLLLTQDDTAAFEAALARVGERGRDVVCVAATHEEVMRILPASDLGLLLRTRSEANEVASPTKLGEYLTAGVPVLTTRHAGDAADVVAAEGCGMVLTEPLPPEEEMERIPALLESIVAARDCVAAYCRSAAVRHRHLDVARRALEQLYGGAGIPAAAMAGREAAL